MSNSTSSYTNGFSLSSVWQRIRRKKQLEGEPASRLDRCLTIPDLTLLSIGAMMGVGIYVLSGEVGLFGITSTRKIFDKMFGKLQILKFTDYFSSYSRFQKKFLDHPSHFLSSLRGLLQLCQEYVMQKWGLGFLELGQHMFILM